MTKAKKVMMAERETMCGYYGANTVQAWGKISDNMKAQSIFGFVAKGLNVSPLHAMLKQLSTNQSIYTQPEVI